MKKYMEGIIECPDPYHDADINRICKIKFEKSKI